MFWCMISKLNETAGLWYYGGAVAYATTGYILGWIGLFNDSWAINAGATFLLGHSMIVAAYLIHECGHNQGAYDRQSCKTAQRTSVAELRYS